MRLISKRFFICSMMAVIISSSSFCETHNMGEGVIKAKISYQNLNRISVKGDRIDSVLGIDTAFHFEKNEKTGEGFIRPTEDNGYAPISLSLTTMTGKTQDLLLEPVDGEPNSIELVSEAVSAEDLSPLMDLSVQEEGTSNDYEETISAAMKKFINLPSNQPIVEVKNVTGRSHQHLKAELDSAYLIDGFLCLKFKVRTSKEDKFILDERMFSRKGDIALSLSTLSIGKNCHAILYVLRK